MNFSLGGITDAINKLTGSLGGGGDSDSVIGLDIGTSTIKMVQLKQKKGAAVLETYGEIALGPYASAEVGQSVNAPQEKVIEALTDLLRESNASSRTGGVAVPLSGSLISVISLPTKNRDDLASMVPIEARKYIPVPVTEVALDWFVIPEEEARFISGNAEEKKNVTDVLLVAIHNQLIERDQAILAGAGVTAKFFEVEPFSMGRASYEHGTAPVMVIDFGASSTRVYIVEFGIISVSHTIPRGGQDITLSWSKSKSMTFAEAEAEKRSHGIENNEVGKSVIEYVLSEARRIFLSYQRKENKAVSKVVLLGGGALLKGLPELSKQYFDAPITLGAPFDRVSAPAFISEVLKFAGPSFASAIGLALRALQR
ncbi:MAG: hypothetical protein RLZZ283_552 [Candidatus Parcubacteria bacterium]